jgi:beta-galactosidase/beta-glucuronidase
MNHVGSYQTSLRIPPEWTGRRIFLNFEGVSSAFYCWVDGSFVGYSQDSRLPAESVLPIPLPKTCSLFGTPSLISSSDWMMTMMLMMMMMMMIMMIMM